MKGCLKQSSRAPSPVKHVAFGSDGSEEIYVADEWDRTPTEPARHLSYQSVSSTSRVYFIDDVQGYSRTERNPAFAAAC